MTIRALAVFLLLIVGITAGAAASPPVAPTIDVQDVTLGVDIRDLVRFQNKFSDLGRDLLALVTADKKEIFGASIQFLPNGPGLESSTQENAVYGVEIQSVQNTNPNDVELTLSALVKNSGTDAYFIFFNVRYIVVSNEWRLVDSSINKVPAQNFAFNLTVGLSQRQMTITSTDGRITKLFPLGVSGFDEGVQNRTMPLDYMTPRVTHAVIDIPNSEYARIKPSYYAGRPFVRITDDVGRFSPIGFHFGFVDPIIRGFMSHGCMRMQDKDLYELWLLGNIAPQPIGVKIRYSIPSKYMHPMPLTDSPYQRIENFGTANAPQFKLDKYDLVILENVADKPKFNLLKPEIESEIPEFKWLDGQAPSGN